MSGDLACGNGSRHGDGNVHFGSGKDGIAQDQGGTAHGVAGSEGELEARVPGAGAVILDTPGLDKGLTGDHGGVVGDGHVGDEHQPVAGDSWERPGGGEGCAAGRSRGRGKGGSLRWGWGGKGEGGLGEPEGEGADSVGLDGFHAEGGGGSGFASAAGGEHQAGEKDEDGQFACFIHVLYLLSLRNGIIPENLLFLFLGNPTGGGKRKTIPIYVHCS